MAPDLSTSQPIDFLLKSFNALDPAVAGAPDQILYNLQDYRLAPITESQTTMSDSMPEESSNYTVNTSVQSSYTDFAISVGLEGSYGPYSGSVQANMEQEQSTSSNTYYSEFSADISFGTLQFYESKNAVEIAACLNSSLITALNSITTLEQAEAFTQIYGTHVVVGLNLGGVLSIVTQIACSSYSNLQTVGASVTAAYEGVGADISLMATATNTAKTAAGSDTFTQTIKIVGGSSTARSQVNIDDAATIQAWVASCDISSVKGLMETFELWRLAPQKTIARTKLKKYLELCLLKHSLENPVVFSASAPIVTEEYIVAKATVDAGYKIISGGAQVSNHNGGNNFLTSCFPSLSGAAINGWQAVSHDCAYPTGSNEYLVAYAIGVYDPANLLNIVCTNANGSNPTTGGDSATAVVKADCLLTGGGCATSTTQQAARWLTGSYPLAPDYNSWLGCGHDYSISSAATLTTWAVGLDASKVPELTISKLVVPQTGGLQSHGNSLATLNNNLKVSGGGVRIAQDNSPVPDRNLLQGSFPTNASGSTGWQEYNADLDGQYDLVTATSFAFALTAMSTDPTITFQPYQQ